MTAKQLTDAGYVETSPGIFTRRSVGWVATAKPEPHQGGALEQGASAKRRSKTSVAGLNLGRCKPIAEVVLVAMLHRRHDDDNLTGGLKPLRDAIASTLGIDDGDPRISFVVSQVQTRGPEGCAVIITQR